MDNVTKKKVKLTKYELVQILMANLAEINGIYNIADMTIGQEIFLMGEYKKYEKMTYDRLESMVVGNCF